jgi:hypothetical protein
MLLKREDLRDRLIRLAGAHDLSRTTEALDDAAHRVGHYLLMQLVVNVTYGLPVAIGPLVHRRAEPPAVGHAGHSSALRALCRTDHLGLFPASARHCRRSRLGNAGLDGRNAYRDRIDQQQRGGALAIRCEHRAFTRRNHRPRRFFWTWLWGPFGLQLSTPHPFCLVVLGQHVPQLAFLDVLFGRRARALAFAQTLSTPCSANDPDEATERAEEFLGGALFCGLPR